MGEVEEAAGLWALPPEAFIAARDALVRRLKADGRPEDSAVVKSLRRPTRDAWVVNRLVASSPEVVAAVIEVGQRLRAAQVQRRGDELRALAADRDAALDRALRAAQRLAGRLTPTVVAAVRSTLLAALADPEAADAVSRGRLSSGLTYAGLGAAPLSSVPPALQPTPPSAAREPAEARRHASPAPPPAAPRTGPDPQVVAAARARLRDTEDELAAAQLAKADAQQQVDELEAALVEARAGLREAQAEVRVASRARDGAARQLGGLTSELS